MEEEVIPKVEEWTLQKILREFRASAVWIRGCGEEFEEDEASPLCVI